jgi:hypothetical protein
LNFAVISSIRLVIVQNLFFDLSQSSLHLLHIVSLSNSMSLSSSIGGGGGGGGPMQPIHDIVTIAVNG